MKLDQYRYYILEQYERGKSIKRLSRELHCSTATVYRFLQRYNLVRSRPNWGKLRLQVNTIIQLWSAGLSSRQISKLIGYPAWNIIQLLNKNGINTSRGIIRATARLNQASPINSFIGIVYTNAFFNCKLHNYIYGE